MRSIIMSFLTLFSLNSFAAETKISISKSLSTSTEAEELGVTAKHVKVFAVIDRIYSIDISDGTYEIEAEILL